MITAIDKNTALVLIDLQKAIVKMQCAHPMEKVLANAAKLVDAFHKANLPVVIVNVNTAGATWTKSRKDNTAQRPAPSAENLEIAPELQTNAGDIFITKHTWGAFFETGLDDELKKRNITNIVLGGVSTSIGVEATARQAGERGYNISFAVDAMTDMFEEAHEKSLKYIFPRIGEAGDSDSIIAKLP